MTESIWLRGVSSGERKKDCICHLNLSPECWSVPAQKPNGWGQPSSSFAYIYSVRHSKVPNTYGRSPKFSKQIRQDLSEKSDFYSSEYMFLRINFWTSSLSLHLMFQHPVSLKSSVGNFHWDTGPGCCLSFRHVSQDHFDTQNISIVHEMHFNRPLRRQTHMLSSHVKLQDGKPVLKAIFWPLTQCVWNLVVRGEPVSRLIVISRLDSPAVWQTTCCS